MTYMPSGFLPAEFLTVFSLYEASFPPSFPTVNERVTQWTGLFSVIRQLAVHCHACPAVIRKTTNKSAKTETMKAFLPPTHEQVKGFYENAQC